MGFAHLVVGFADLVLPRSIGGYAGAAMARAALNRGWSSAYSVILPQGWTKTLIFIVVAPIMGLVLALFFSSASYWLLRNQTPRNVDKWFRKLQLLSAAAYSLGHGGNDAQKTMGINRGSLVHGSMYERGRDDPRMGSLQVVHHSGRAHCHCPGHIFWWRANCSYHGIQNYQAEALGGFCAETAGALTLFGTALAGIPVSTTHTITGAIIGVGAVHRLSAVR